MKGQDVLFSSHNQNWNTPKWFFDELDKEFNFLLDCCTSDDNPLGTPYFYTEKTNGLSEENMWLNTTFCNPPYGRKNNMHLWLERASLEQNKGIVSVFLLPSRTGTSWFHDYIYKKPNIEIRFLKGRLRFDVPKLINHYDNSQNSAPFDSMVVVFR